MVVQRIRQPRVAEIVASRLREDILSGRLKEGDVLLKPLPKIVTTLTYCLKEPSILCHQHLRHLLLAYEELS